MIRQQLDTATGAWERMVWFQPGWDLRATRQGIHSMHLCFIIRPATARPAFAAVAEFSTGWYPRTVEENWNVIEHTVGGSGMPQWECAAHHAVRQTADDYQSDSCRWLAGQTCWCSGGWTEPGLAPSLAISGDDAVWGVLQQVVDAAQQQAMATTRRERALDEELGAGRPHPGAVWKGNW